MYPWTELQTFYDDVIGETTRDVHVGFLPEISLTSNHFKLLLRYLETSSGGIE